jgi:phosphoribosylglycinamide formyltransferase 2
MISQNLSEFALHARAILGLPVGEIEQYGPAASYAVIAHGVGHPEVGNLAEALNRGALEGIRTEVRVFGKPEVNGERRVAVALALAPTLDEAVQSAQTVGDTLSITVK